MSLCQDALADGMPVRVPALGVRQRQPTDERLAKAAPLLAMVGNWRALLDSAQVEEEIRDLREHSRTGRPLGSSSFVERLEKLVGRTLRAKKGGQSQKLSKLPQLTMCLWNTRNTYLI